MSGYKEENGQVILTMSVDDWHGLLLALGYAAGGCRESNRREFYSILGLVNRLNEGNRHFTPYELETSGDDGVTVASRSTRGRQRKGE